MMDPKDALFAGAVVNSALYLLAVFVAALFNHNQVAEYLAIVSFGTVYLSYIVQAVQSNAMVNLVIVAISILVSAAAGLALL